MGLSNEQIKALLAEPTPKRGGGGKRKKVDPTEERVIGVWFKLDHHMCTNDCEHRKQSPSGKACWNTNCHDHTRTPDKDRGVNLVSLVKGQYMCRYCFLAGWLQGE